MTPLGVGAALAGAAMLAAGLADAWSALAVPGAAMLLLWAACGVWASWRPALRLDRRVEPPVVAKGRDARLVVSAANRSRRTLRSVVVEQPVGQATVRVRLAAIGARRTAQQAHPLPTTTRGCFEIGPAAWVRADAFGLWRRVRGLGAPQQLTVTPRVVALRPLPAGTSRLVEGPTSDAAPQGSTTFHRLREYVPGDDLRTVHWPTSARTGTLVVRHNVDTAQQATELLFDLRAAAYTVATFDEAVDLVASVVATTNVGRAPVTLRTTSGASMPVGPDTMAWLTTVSPDEGASLESALSALGARGRASTLVVVTGRAEPAGLRAVAAVARRYQKVVLAAVSATAPPALAGVTVISGTDLDTLRNGWDAATLRAGGPVRRW